MSFEEAVFSAFSKMLREVQWIYTKREILLAVSCYFKHEQMLCLQNFENLAIIVKKAFGSDKSEPEKVSSDSELRDAIAFMNG